MEMVRARVTMMATDLPPMDQPASATATAFLPTLLSVAQMEDKDQATANMATTNPMILSTLV